MSPYTAQGGVQRSKGVKGVKGVKEACTRGHGAGAHYLWCRSDLQARRGHLHHHRTPRLSRTCSGGGGQWTDKGSCNAHSNGQ